MKKKLQTKKTWKYPENFKLKAVKLSLQKGVVVKDVAIMLDIHPGLLSRWRKEFREGKIVDDGRVKVSDITEEKKELDRVTLLEKENTRLREENKLLKKWRRFLGEQHQKNIDLYRETDN